MNEIWAIYDETTKPTDKAYYMVHYTHKDGYNYSKAIMWDGECFAYKDYVVNVLAYMPDSKAPYYTECMKNAQELVEKEESLLKDYD